MKCLVTGGAGFIGSHIVNRLVDDNHEVIVIDNLVSGKKENINPNVTFYELDITEMDVRALYHMFEGVDVVFHLAAFPRVEPIQSHNVNVNGTLNVLKACVDHKVKRFVLTSSSAVYGEAQIPTTEFDELKPMSPYALHKLIGEQYCRLFSDLYGIETVCLRYSNVYGEGQPTSGSYCNVMGIFIQQKQRGE